MHESDPRAEDDEIHQETVVLPTRLRCFVCELRLASHAEVHSAGLGGQYAVDHSYDPIDFFNIEIGELHEFEYDNE